MNRLVAVRVSAFAIAILSPAWLRADPEARVREAADALARTSYAWETTVRQRFRGATAEPRLNPAAPIAVRGKVGDGGMMEIVAPPTREMPVPIAAISRYGDVVGFTPLGWMRRTQMREVTGGDRRVDFQGHPVRLSRALAAALDVTATRAFAEELFDLVAEAKSWREESGLVLAELRDETIEELWGDRRARSAPEIQGTIIFKLGGEGLQEVHTLLAIGFPNRRDKTIDWTMQQWSTRIGGIGETTIDVPAAALEALEH